MTPFVSKYKSTNKATDIALLTYPHTVLDRNKETVTVVDTVEDAEELCGLLWDDMKDRMEIDYICQMEANRKLNDAWKIASERRAAREAKEAKFQRKEYDKARRREIRLDNAAEEFKEDKAAEFEHIREDLRDLVARLDAVDHDFTRAVYKEIGSVAAQLGELRAKFHNHSFGVTSSRIFRAACASQK